MDCLLNCIQDVIVSCNCWVVRLAEFGVICHLLCPHAAVGDFFEHVRAIVYVECDAKSGCCLCFAIPAQRAIGEDNVLSGNGFVQVCVCVQPEQSVLVSLFRF